MTFDLSTYRREHMARRRRLMGAVPAPRRAEAVRPIVAPVAIERQACAPCPGAHLTEPSPRERAIKDALRAIEHPISRIVRETAERHGLTPRDLTRPSRKAPVVKARQEAMAEAFRLDRFSLLEIGRRLNRDHTTVLHAVHKLGASQPPAPATTMSDATIQATAMRVAVYDALRSGHWVTRAEASRHVRAMLGSVPRLKVIDTARLIADLMRRSEARS